MKRQSTALFQDDSYRSIGVRISNPGILKQRESAVLSDYKMLEAIDTSSNNTVVRAIHRISANFAAVKIIPKTEFKSNSCQYSRL
jgi:hypothetical protein